MACVGTTQNHSRESIVSGSLLKHSFPSSMFTIVDEITCQLSDRLKYNLFPNATSARCLMLAKEQRKEWALMERRDDEAKFSMYTSSILLQQGLYDLADQFYVASSANHPQAAAISIAARHGKDGPDVRAINRRQSHMIAQFCSDVRRFGLNVSQGDEKYHIDLLLDGDGLWIANNNPINDQETEIAHMFLVPSVIVVLLLALSSWRLLIIPFLCLVIALVVSRAFHLAVAMSMLYSDFGETIILFLCVCMSIDWYLFFLSRFQEEYSRERAGGESAPDEIYLDGIRPASIDLSPVHWRCCVRTFSSASVTVIGSGVIIAISLLSLVFLNATEMTVIASCGFITLVQSRIFSAHHCCLVAILGMYTVESGKMSNICDGIFTCHPIKSCCLFSGRCLVFT